MLLDEVAAPAGIVRLRLECEQMSETRLLGGIEAGGSKFVCAIAADPLTPLEIERFPTLDPETTLARVARFFRRAEHWLGRLHALGIGTFGPAGVNPSSGSYGTILKTPKANWSGFDFLATLRRMYRQAPPSIVFETDVNAAAVGEGEYGAGRGFRHVAYLTVGTGIGGGFLHRGVPLHGRMHPEIGHMFIPLVDHNLKKNSTSPPDSGVCSFHEACLEGHASGPALEKRWGHSAKELPEDHRAWALETDYLALAILNLTASWSPEIVIVGGGVSQKPGLMAAIRQRFAVRAGDYWELPALEKYIVPPALGQRAGIVGALTLASRSLVSQDSASMRPLR